MGSGTLGALYPDAWCFAYTFLIVVPEDLVLLVQLFSSVCL